MERTASSEVSTVRFAEIKKKGSATHAVQYLYHRPVPTVSMALPNIQTESQMNGSTFTRQTVSPLLSCHLLGVELGL